MHITPRAAVLGVTALAIGGCGGGGGGSGTKPQATATPTAKSATSAGRGTVLPLLADKSQLKFNKSALSAKAGRVTIVMRNPSPSPHDVAITGQGVNVAGKVVNQGGTSTVSTPLKPGTYTFYCSVDGHRQAGMQGTLTVK